MLINFGNGNRGPGGRGGSGGVMAILLREMFVKKEKMFGIYHTMQTGLPGLRCIKTSIFPSQNAFYAVVIL